MNQKEIQEQILIAGLEASPQLGWSLATLDQVAQELGHPCGMAYLVFPQGMNQVLEILNQYFDQQMIQKMSEMNLDELRTHEKIRHILGARLISMQPYYQGLIQVSKYYVHPIRIPIMVKGMWQTVDQMWYLANDQSLDYNYYTKRGLLYMVHSATLTYWMARGADDLAPVFNFMDLRLQNVASVPKLKFKIKEIFSTVGRRA